MRKLNNYKIFLEKKDNDLNILDVVEEGLKVIIDDFNLTGFYVKRYGNDKVELLTDNPKDMKISISNINDMIHIYIKQTSGVPFEINKSFEISEAGKILSIIRHLIESEPEKCYSSDKPNKEVQEPQETQEEITPKSPKTKGKPNLNIPSSIIREVLEESYILDEIDLKNLDLTELLRRMIQRKLKSN